VISGTVTMVGRTRRHRHAERCVMSEQTRSGTTDDGGAHSADAMVGRSPVTATTTTGWVGWIFFAAIMLITVGLFNVIDGLVALFRGDLYTVTPNGLLVFDLTAWGWVHLILGVIQLAVAFPLLRGARWARVLTILLAVVNAATQLAFLSAFPVWAVIVIALDVLVIWAVVVHGDELETGPR